MKGPESPEIRKECWEIIRELHRLSDIELQERLFNSPPSEISTIETACYNADPRDSTGSDGSRHIVRANARRAGMQFEDFQDEIIRIEGAIEKLKENA